MIEHCLYGVKVDCAFALFDSLSARQRLASIARWSEAMTSQV